MQKRECLKKILLKGVIPVMISDGLDPIKITEAVFKVGGRCIEISARRPDCLKIIESIKRYFPEMAVGAASLIEEGPYLEFLRKRIPPFPSIGEAVEAGADFLVSMLPFSEETYRKFKNTKIIIPGVPTIAEAVKSLNMGANIIKFLGPQLIGGASYFSNIDPASHKGIPFFVTGGMKKELIRAFINVNVLVVGGGFDLLLGENYNYIQDSNNYKTALEELDPYYKEVSSARLNKFPEVDFENMSIAKISNLTGRFFNA